MTSTEEERKAAAMREVQLQFNQLCPPPMPGTAVVGRIYQAIAMKLQADLTRLEREKAALIHTVGDLSGKLAKANYDLTRTEKRLKEAEWLLHRAKRWIDKVDASHQTDGCPMSLDCGLDTFLKPPAEGE